MTGEARQQGLGTGQTVGSHGVGPATHITVLGGSEMTASPSDVVGFHPEANPNPRETDGFAGEGK